jgi:transposase
MVGRELWEAIRQAAHTEGLSVSALARRFEVDRKTVRRCLRRASWQPYQRVARPDTLLSVHAAFLRQRAPEGQYSARILYQELTRGHDYRGSDETVKLFVRPLRAVRLQAERALTRFETPPGLQSQIDWGEAQVYFGHRCVKQHLFVLTLGYSRRAFYAGYANAQLGTFLEAHEHAFAHFGGHTREHLYDRPRTVCRPTDRGGVVWNSTFKAFADYWGFEPRLCRAYRAQTKGKVESGVTYVKRNFLPGRGFIDQADFDAQLAAWNAPIADVRIHGTTHERPLERFEGERPHVVPTTGQPSFQLERRLPRVVAEDYLVSFQTNRYSVSFTLIGQTVEVSRQGAELHIFHRAALVARHPLLEGQHQMRILPEHGPGAIARNARRREARAPQSNITSPARCEVEVRDLALDEQLLDAEVAP